jgi:hypothetical protein
MLLTVQFDYLRRFRFGRSSGVRGVTRAFRYRKETGGAEQVANRYSHASPHGGYDLASPETNQPPSVAVSKMGQQISVLHADSSSVSWGPTK